MATSNEEKGTSNTDKEPENSAENSAAAAAAIISSESTNIIDGRIFEADREQTLSSEEQAEVQEFELTLKKYNDLSKKMRKDALKKEREELNEAEKSPKMRYYEGTRSERIKILETETKLMEEMEKKVVQRA